MVDLCKQFGKIVGRGGTPVHNGSDRLVWFLYFYQSFYGWGGRVQVDVFPFAVWRD